MIYLYPSEDAARQGKATGGSGFLLAVPSSVVEEKKHIYAVTNQHVTARSRVVRMNTRGGGTDILPLGPEQWLDHPAGDDLSIAFIPDEALRGFYYRSIHEEMLLSKAEMDQQGIGPGEDVCMVGRFVTHEGRKENRPTVRFGNISQMPWEPIYQPERAHWQESFLIEMRSHGAYSGSPVFNIFDPHVIRTGAPGDISEETFLIGVDWGHILTLDTVLQEDGRTPAKEGWKIKAHSGQSGVVPAWRLRELLDWEPVMRARQQEDEGLAKKEGSVSLDAATEAIRRRDQTPNG